MTRNPFVSKPIRIPIRFVQEDEDRESDMKDRETQRHSDSQPEEVRFSETTESPDPDRESRSIDEPECIDVASLRGEVVGENGASLSEPEVTPSGDSGNLPTDVIELRRQLEASLTREKRWLADLKNYQRRTERLFEEQADQRKRDFAVDLLEIIDDLDRALDHSTTDDAALGQGVEAIRDKLLTLLSRHGIHPFQPLHEPFDPTTQEAVSVIQHPELESNSVAQVLRTGWKYGDKLLRPAHVIVVKNPETP